MNCARGRCAASYSFLSPTCSSTRESSFRCLASQSVETIIESLAFVFGWAGANVASAANKKAAINSRAFLCMINLRQTTIVPGHYNIDVSSNDPPSSHARTQVNSGKSFRGAPNLRTEAEGKLSYEWDTGVFWDGPDELFLALPSQRRRLFRAADRDPTSNLAELFQLQSPVGFPNSRRPTNCRQDCKRRDSVTGRSRHLLSSA